MINSCPKRKLCVKKNNCRAFCPKTINWFTTYTSNNPYAYTEKAIIHDEFDISKNLIQAITNIEGNIIEHRHPVLRSSVKHLAATARKEWDKEIVDTKMIEETYNFLKEIENQLASTLQKDTNG